MTFAKVTLAVVAGFFLLCILAVSFGNSMDGGGGDGSCDGGFWGSSQTC